MMQFTAEQMADLVSVAYSRANADGVVTAEELTRELALASQELATAEMRKKRASLLAAPPVLFVATSTPVGDVAAVKAWQDEKETAQAQACRKKLKENVAVIEGFGAVVTSVGSALVTGGVTLPTAGLALLPAAEALLDYLSSDDGEAPVFEVPVFGEGTKGTEGTEVKARGINAAVARGDLAVESGHAEAPHHGNPHHEPLKPGHHDTTGHKPGPTHHPV